jgi:hypothetical protein
MKKLVPLVILILAAAGTAFAQPGVTTREIGKTAKKIADAYGAANLASLDNSRLTSGGVKVTIEDSIGGGLETKRFKSFAGADRWLKKQVRRDGTPFRVSWPLVGCRGGRCTFFLDGGILHNHLYLKRVFYTRSKGRLVVTSIYLLDGA